MEHIRQIPNSNIAEEIYTVVISTGYGTESNPLSEHPAILEHPDKFEIVSTPIPEIHQYLKYTG